MRRRRTTNSIAPIMDLPEHIMVEILLRLPIKGIVMSKCTCWTWRHLISSAYFVELNYARAKACILVRSKNFYQVSRTLHLIQPSDINSMYCCCNKIETSLPVNMKLDTKLKIPLLNYDMYLGRIGDAEASAICKGITKRKPTIKMDPGHRHEFDLVNSCNGLLCLISDTGLTIVCSPVTNKYINLPAHTVLYTVKHTGFGFCQETKQYKVLRVLTRGDQCPIKVEMHTLGTNSWEGIGSPPSFYKQIRASVYLNGVLYWIGGDDWRSRCILSFQFSTESFRLLPQPPIIHPKSIRMGIIGDSPCLCADFGNSIGIWIVKNCGVQESWSMLVSVCAPELWQTWYCHVSLLTSCSEC